MLSIVVALTNNNVIGSKDRIPWLLRSDLVKLKNLTLGKVVILGRKTYDSMVWYYNKSGRDMPGGTYIVVTSNPKYKPEKGKTIVTHSLQEAIDKAGKIDNGEVFVIGGATIFASALPLADKLYITEVKASIDGDVLFPEINKATWSEASRESYKKDEINEYDYSFVTYERR